MKSRKKILIVDDSEMNRSLLTDMLSNDFDIIEAENGMEAAAILHEREQEISLMLLDIVMPVMDGFELLALMNKNGWIKSIPVIMISAETVPAYVDRAYDLGVIEYINRPFDERTVLHRVTSSIMLMAKQKELSHMVTTQMYEKEKTNRLMIEILSNIVEFRNGESGLHVLHIQTITELFLEDLSKRDSRYALSEEDKSLICTASALHDIGKIAVPSEILNKPGRLTKEEFEVIKTHSAEGARMLNDIPMRGNEPLIQFGYQICRWHHERYDGRGYPDGLKGDAIPIAAQVVALADVYDALTSTRVYKPAYSHDTAIQMILNGECGAFNPVLLDCLRSVSDQLRRQMMTFSLEHNSEREILKAVDRMVKANDVEASERTLCLLEREKMKYQFLADTTAEVVFEYTSLPEMVMLSQRGAEYLGLPQTIMAPRTDALGTEVFQKADFEQLLDALHNTTPERPIVEKKYQLQVRGVKHWFKVYARALWLTGKEATYEGAIGKLVDLHDESEHFKTLEKRSDTDALTGLLNHNAAREQIVQRLEDLNHKDGLLMLMNLENFKQANDSYGHLFCDEVLQYVAGILRESVREADIVARLAGDEFLVFAECGENKTVVADRIMGRMHQPYKTFVPEFRMGIARAAECGGDYEQLFCMANIAMYSVKKESKNGYRFYDDVPGNERTSLMRLAEEALTLRDRTDKGE
jgi:putative two-component system response regulator